MIETVINFTSGKMLLNEQLHRLGNKWQEKKVKKLIKSIVKANDLIVNIHNVWQNPPTQRATNKFRTAVKRKEKQTLHQSQCSRKPEEKKGELIEAE